MVYYLHKTELEKHLCHGPLLSQFVESESEYLLSQCPTKSVTDFIYQI